MLLFFFSSFSIYHCKIENFLNNMYSSTCHFIKNCYYMLFVQCTSDMEQYGWVKAQQIFCKESICMIDAKVTHTRVKSRKYFLGWVSPEWTVTASGIIPEPRFDFRWERWGLGTLSCVPRDAPLFWEHCSTERTCKCSSRENQVEYRL